MESDSEMDMLVESFDGTESDDDLSLGESFDALVCVRTNAPYVLVTPLPPPLLLFATDLG